MEIAYFKSLIVENPDVGERYQWKLKIINGLDPYTLDMESLNTSIDGVPPITNMDIVSYLVLTHIFYTKEQIRAYKSLQAHKYFESGFVVKAGTKRITDLFVLIGKVKHSQRLSAKPLEVWCIVGNVAHCTCIFEQYFLLRNMPTKKRKKYHALMYVLFGQCLQLRNKYPLCQCETWTGEGHLPE